MQTPHDTLFQFTFHHAHHAVGWLRHVLPVELAMAVDWTRLLPIRERFPGVRVRPHLADGGFIAPVRLDGVERELALPTEHKSSFFAALAGQVLRYSIHLQRALQRELDQPPLVLPVVLRHGWVEPRRVAAADSTLVRWLRDAQPRQHIVLHDLDDCSEQVLAGAGLTPLAELTLLCLKHLRNCDGAQVAAAFRRWQHLLRAVDAAAGPPAAPPLGADAIDAIGWYALAVTEIDSLALADTFAGILQRDNFTIMSTLERTFQKGRLQGLSEGKLEGKLEGRVEALQRLLLRRFGAVEASVVERLRSATPVELDRWLDRVLDAPTPAALFTAS